MMNSLCPRQSSQKARDTESEEVEPFSLEAWKTQPLVWVTKGVYFFLGLCCRGAARQYFPGRGGEIP